MHWAPGVALAADVCPTLRPPVPARRQRLEHMKLRRRNWELVYQHVTRADALCTLGAIEEANARVEELLSEESRERHSVSGERCAALRCAALCHARAAAHVSQKSTGKQWM